MTQTHPGQTPAVDQSKLTMTTTVFKQLMTIRKGGSVNMLDRPGVQSEANDRDFYDAVVWIEDNKKSYGQFVFGNFQVVDPETGEVLDQTAMDGIELSIAEEDEDEDNWSHFGE
jgi:hypothetical protein